MILLTFITLNPHVLYFFFYRKQELKRAKTKKKKLAKEAKEAKEKIENEKQIIMDFNIQLDQPLGMKIDHVDGHNTWPAEITAVVENGQAATAGVMIGMYVIAMNDGTSLYYKNFIIFFIFFTINYLRVHLVF